MNNIITINLGRFTFALDWSGIYICLPGLGEGFLDFSPGVSLTGWSRWRDCPR